MDESIDDFRDVSSLYWGICRVYYMGVMKANMNMPGSVGTFSRGGGFPPPWRRGSHIVL